MSQITMEPTDGRGDWKEFLCRACGMIYNERDGDPDSGILPGTRFEDIPEDWSCPICGVRKRDFEPYVRAKASGRQVAPVARRVRGGVVILGAGTAGWSAAEAIRAADPAVAITIVTSCRGTVYNKPELAVALQRGMSPDRMVRETGTEAAARLNLQLLSETIAVGISAKTRRVRTTRGPIHFDSLVLALGAKPIIPPSFDPKLCWRINTLETWSLLHSQLQHGSRRIAVIGAGMVGCELAEDFARAGHAVSLISMTPEPLEGLMPVQVGGKVRRGLEGLGVTVIGGETAEEMSRLASGAISVTLSGGRRAVFDHIVSAVGLATQSRMIRSAGIAFNGGIVVDASTLQTNSDCVFALGDCISIGGTACRFIEPISHQAATIAAQVTGGVATHYHHRPPVIRLKTRSAPVIVEGAIRRDAAWQIETNSDGSLVMVQRDGDKVTARLVA